MQAASEQRNSYNAQFKMAMASLRVVHLLLSHGCEAGGREQWMNEYHLLRTVLYIDAPLKISLATPQ